MKAIGKALFLDLDGTLIETKSGDTFPRDTEDWRFIPGVIPQVNKYVDRGYHIMIVSNQGGIEVGHIKLNDFRHKIRQVYNEIIIKTGCPFAMIGYRYCVSNNPENYFRKPNPGMGYDIALSYVLDLSQSLMVGDASGRIKRQEPVFIDESSHSGWSYKDGQNVSDVDIKRIAQQSATGGTIYFRDHADSDLRFAQACGMQYQDILEFLDVTNRPSAQQNGQQAKLFS